MLKKTIFISLLCIYTSYANGEIYKWVDEQGAIHYGDKPIVNSKEMDIRVKETKNENIKISQSREERRKKLLQSYAEDNKREAEEKDKRKKQKKKLQKNCAHSKDRLRNYERAGYLYDLDKDGNRVVVSNVERDKITTDLKKNIKKFCK